MCVCVCPHANTYMSLSLSGGHLGRRQSISPELVALLSLSSWCLVTVVWLFLAVPWVSLQFVIVVFPGHTHLLFSYKSVKYVI